MQEKTERNKSLYEYHLKHPHTGCTKMGRVFKLSPSAVWRILQREKKRRNWHEEIHKAQMQNETYETAHETAVRVA